LLRARPPLLCFASAPPVLDSAHGCCFARRYGDKYGYLNPGVWFDSDGSRTVKALVYSFVSNVKFTSTFSTAESVNEMLNAFEKKIMATAPEGTALDKGFVVSELSFFDLQRSIGSGAYTSFLASTVMAFAILLFTTQNFILTLYSCIAIVMITGTCTGILVMDGWELNILESIIFSVAVGMAVDFVAHYSHT
jgi:predicted RND superfamily exporter protein